MTVTLKGSATGSFFSNHDPLYAWAHDLHGGTLIGDTGGPTSLARREMTATGTTSCETTLPCGADWRAVAMRWAWCKEGAGTGNVIFQVRYGLWYPLLGTSATALSLTTVAIPAASVGSGAAGTSFYALPTETSAIATPVDGFIGTSPILSVSVDRLGDDASDTYASSVGLVVVTFTRVD
jgi:hypothetical protein